MKLKIGWSPMWQGGGEESQGSDSEMFSALSLQPEDENRFFIAGNRHDKDRVEIQFGFDGLVGQDSKDFIYDVDLAIFVPKSLGLLDVEEESALRNDFQSQVRLHTHASNPDSESSLQRVSERLKNLIELPSIEKVRLLAVEFEGFVKATTKKIKREFLASRNDLRLLPQMFDQVQSVADLVEQYRGFLAKYDVERLDAIHSTPGTIEHDLLLLSEYLSHVYVQFLVAVEFSLKEDARFVELCDLLRKLESRESDFRAQRHFLIEGQAGEDSHEDEDLYLRRVSLLKKYFHKSLYVNYVGESLKTKMLIPVYGISAALAASWAIMVQMWQVQSMYDRVGINSIAFISIAILGYVTKDIMKDFLRKYFFKTSHKFFADYERKLFVERGGQRAKLGVIKEYVRSLDSGQLPQDLKTARYSGLGGEIEEFLHEDILHYKKRVTLNLKQLGSGSDFPWGLREVLRYRFDRMLPSMEDAFKSLYLVSKGGEGASRQSHRVYHVYIACWIRRHASLWRWSRRTVSTKPAFKAYRVTLDKTGVLDCVSVKWRQSFGIPSLPE